MKKLFLAFSVVLTVIFVGCNPDANFVSPENSQLLKSGNSYTLTQQEIDGLIHMRIEEKLARDVYTVLGSAYNSQVFLNIKVSEQSHMDAVKRMLVKYNISDPLVTDEVGVFPTEEFQTLYNQLIEQGYTSLYDALLAGVTIEELDIADLDAQLAVVTNPGLINLYSNLKAGSVSHLSAFNKNLSVCINAAITEL